MGNFGRIAIGARGQVSFNEEEDWGYPLPPLHRLDFKTEGLTNEIGNLVSEALNPNRGISKRTRGTSNISGDVAFEQNTEGYEIIYKHAFGDAVTIFRCDGGIRTRLTQKETTGATTLHVEDTSNFKAVPGDFDLAIVYKDSAGKLQVYHTTYSASTATDFTVGITTVDLTKGAWVMQTYNGANAWWDNVYTHYIEAAKTLPAGMTFEVGRDVAYFVYSGMKINTIENTYEAQQILQGTFNLIGKGEYTGGLLSVAASVADTTLTLKKFTTSGPATNTINDAVFSGVGVNDMTSGGTYTGVVDRFVVVEIDSAGAGVADTFKWSLDNGETWEATGVTITAAAQTLVDGIQVTFTTDGSAVGGSHTLFDRWHFHVAVPQIIGFDNAGGTFQLEDENDLVYGGVNVGAGQLTGIPAAGEGSISEAHPVDVPVVGQDSWGDPNPPAQTDMLSSFQAAVYIDGSAQEVLSGNWNLNNNLYTDKFQLGDRYRAGLPEQQRTVEGLIHVEFDDLILYKKYIEGTPAFLEFRSVDDSEVIGTDGVGTTNDVYAQKHVILPHIEYTGTTPVIGGPEIIEHDMNFTALQDEENNINEIAVIFVNTINRMF